MKRSNGTFSVCKLDFVGYIFNEYGTMILVYIFKKKYRYMSDVQWVQSTECFQQSTFLVATGFTGLILWKLVCGKLHFSDPVQLRPVQYF